MLMHKLSIINEYLPSRKIRLMSELVLPLKNLLCITARQNVMKNTAESALQ